MTPPAAAASMVGTSASPDIPRRDPKNSAMTRYDLSWIPPTTDRNTLGVAATTPIHRLSITMSSADKTNQW